MVEHATKLNEAALSAMSGVPLCKARITCGGFYDALWFRHWLRKFEILQWVNDMEDIAKIFCSRSIL